ncbi:MAG: CotH kinase family protein, partial [Prolixibacteraceae bacterium]|nr:CotH kinase family protein [Prolixibacteraceae bacterium]
YDPQGTLVDYVKYGPQLYDVSYGRKPDGGENWYYFGEPTPEASNSTEGLTTLVYAETPSISPEGNMYSSGQTVALSVNSINSVNSVIYYTTDGSIPTKKSNRYSNPIKISNTTVIKARVFENGKLPGKVITHTFFINVETFNLPVISYSTNPEYLFGNEKGIYDNILKMKEIPISLEYFDSDGSKSFSVNAGSRIAGLNIWNYAQKPFTIYLRGKYGDESINYKLFKERNIGTYTKLALRNAGDDWEGAFFRDPLLQYITEGQMTNPVQSYQPAILFINGVYWGLINVRDKFDEQYFMSNLNVAPNNIDHLRYGYDDYHNFNLYIEIGDSLDYVEMVRFMVENDMSVQSNYEYIESLMDIGSYIDWVIQEVYVANTSWRHNHEWWRDRTNNGKWQWMNVDMDRGFNKANVNGNLLDDFIENSYSGAKHGDPIFKNLIENEYFKNYFIHRYVTHINTTYNPNRIIRVIDSMQNNIREAMPDHIDRWSRYNSIKSVDDWENEVEELREFARERSQPVYNQISNEFNLSGRVSLTVEVEQPKCGSVFINDVLATKETYSAQYFSGVPVYLKAIPDVGYQFSHWEGGATGSSTKVEINPGSDVSVKAVFVPSGASILMSPVAINTILTEENSPYYTSGDIIVNPNVTLQINEGVTIYMAEKSSFYVYGNLNVYGTDKKPVLITENYTVEAEEWGAVCFENCTGTSSISYLILDNATKGNDPYKFFAAISAYNASLKLDHITIEDIKTQPIFTQFGTVELTNSKLHSTATCDLINAKFAEYALVENCNLKGNNAFDTDAVDYDQITNGIIRGNRIHGFKGFNSDGIDIGEESQNLRIYNNFIYDCTDKGISIGQASSAIIENNVIMNCDMGLGIKDYGAFGFITNNTFYGNSIGVACYEKNFLSGGGGATVKNCIFADSRQVPFFVDELSSLTVSYSLSNTSKLTGEGNILASPMFANPGTNFRLLINSPCINAGDPASPEDKDGSRADIGAYPFEIEEALSVVINEINYHSSSEYDTGDWIELYNYTGSDIDLSGWLLFDENSGNQYRFPSNTTIGANAYIVICQDTSKFKSLVTDAGYLGNLNFALNNAGEYIILYDESLNVIDSVNYNDHSPWPEDPDGLGFTLSLIKPYLDNNLPESWVSSYLAGGSPGKPNDYIPEIKNIVINEFCAVNNSTIADENGEYNDWIELYNAGGEAVNIAGLYMTDNFALPRKFRFPNTDPELTTIPSKGYLLLWADNDEEQGILHLNFKLDGEVEQIGLIEANGIDFIDSLSYYNQRPDTTFGRIPNATGPWFYMLPTPNAFNMTDPIITSIPDTGVVSLISSEAGQLVLYPNPSDGLVNIVVKDIQGNAVKIDIRNIQGQTMLFKALYSGGNEFRTKLDLSSLNRGVFFVIVSTNRSYSVKKLFVK